MRRRAVQLSQRLVVGATLAGTLEEDGTDGGELLWEEQLAAAVDVTAGSDAVEEGGAAGGGRGGGAAPAP